MNYYNGSWDALHTSGLPAEMFAPWHVILGQPTQIELERIVDELCHGNGIDPCACTRHDVVPPDYVRFPDTMTKADLAQLRREDERYRREHAAQVREDSCFVAEQLRRENSGRDWKPWQVRLSLRKPARRR